MVEVEGEAYEEEGEGGGGLAVTARADGVDRGALGLPAVLRVEPVA